jgi:hypothetical protein
MTAPRHRPETSSGVNLADAPLSVLMATATCTAYKSFGGLVVAQGMMTQEVCDNFFNVTRAEAGSPQYRCVAPAFRCLRAESDVTQLSTLYR